MNLRVLLLIVCGLALVACKAPTEPVDPETVNLDPGGEGELLPDVDPATIDLRNRRRMDLDQLKAAIARVSDGRAWTDAAGRDQFDNLSATLGKPDYAESTDEDLTVSPLFMKFLGDAARAVCDQMAEEERSMDPAQRVLYPLVAADDTVTSNPTGVNENLAELVLMYHGRRLDPASQELNPWAWLFESATMVTDDPVKGWRTVCTALITHPDFYTY